MKQNKNNLSEPKMETTMEKKIFEKWVTVSKETQINWYTRKFGNTRVQL